MTIPIYLAGQLVRVAGNSLSGPRTLDQFRIVRRYPVSGMPDLYRLKSIADPSERMVPVHELTMVLPFMATVAERRTAVAAFAPADLPVWRAEAA